MSLTEKQQRLIARYAVIEDAHERLAAVVGSAKKRAGLEAAEKVAAHRVAGCVSNVWLIASVEDGRCRFRMDADSPLVKGLVALLCGLYDDAPAAEVTAVEPEILEALGLAQTLSPTRLQGLASVRRAIRDFAASQSAP